MKQSFSEAAGEARGLGLKFDGVMKGIGVAAAASAAAVTAAFVGAGAFVANTMRDFVNLGGDLHDMAANVGVSVESLHGLGLVAEQSGAGVAEVAESYKFLGKNIAEAMQGSKEAVDGFARMGVRFADAGGAARPLEAVMMDVADALAALPPGAQRTEAAMQLLGRGGTQMIGTLSQGSRALEEQMRRHREYGATLTTEAAQRADAFGDMLDEFNKAWLGIKNTIAAPLVEGLTPVLAQALESLRVNIPDIRKGFSMRWRRSRASSMVSSPPCTGSRRRFTSCARP
jgi:TP901 family phage tail tape measure protein